MGELIEMPPYDVEVLTKRAVIALNARGIYDITNMIIYKEVARQRGLQLKEWRDGYCGRPIHVPMAEVAGGTQVTAEATAVPGPPKGADHGSVATDSNSHPPEAH